MNKAEYFKELEFQLSGLSEEDRKDAMEYFHEYLEEAGEENEKSILEEWGSPAELAAKIKKESGGPGPKEKSEPQGEYQNIKITASGIRVILQQGERFAVEHRLSDRVRINRIETVDSTLYIDCQLKRKTNYGIWQEKLTVCYPKDVRFESVEGVMKAGSISISGLSANALSIQNEAGDLLAEGVNATKLSVQNKVGRICLNTVCGETGSIQSGAGDIDLKSFRFAGEVQAKAGCGRIQLSRGSGKALEVRADKGEIVGKELTAAGACRFHSSLGRIVLNDVKCGECSANSGKGSVEINRLSAEKLTGTSDLGSLAGDHLSTRSLFAKVNCGSIRLAGKLEGKNEMMANLGSIVVSTSVPKEECSYHVSSNMGSTHVDGVKTNGSSSQIGKTTYEISVSMGDARLNFTGGDSNE